ncbi:hypothetical protein EH31_07790 [Erythrobacter longus]|uniref:Uncharacterized protein n=1 Tax=Erythrobacter longus TaxID=1044 RepID=A0A074M814_ERYLO|nr:hypothetical protein EH31_07790 [Erythrobacter longus]
MSSLDVLRYAADPLRAGGRPCDACGIEFAWVIGFAAENGFARNRKHDRAPAAGAACLPV